MKSKVFKKAGSAVLAAALALNASSVGSFLVSAEETKFEFEDATITGDVTVESGSSASGGSYLKMTDSGTITLKFNADAAGMYKMTIYAGGIGGAKQQNLTVNGTAQGALAIPSSSGFEAITISAIKLQEGENTLVIEKSWGWSNFDYMTIEAATLPSIRATQVTPVDSEAIDEAKNLMSYFNSVYGEHIISGQQEIYSGGPHGLETEFEYLENLTGELPAIRGFDYGNFCCPAYGSDDGSTDRIIDWVKNKNGIATASFHLNVPTDFASFTIGSKIDWAQTTYSEKTDFSPSEAATPGTKENQYYLEALTILAKEFNDLEAQGIPVLWRPLHEAEGGGGETASWFWWGREGSEAYKKLWIYTYETLTNDLDCHNLIWEWNSYDFTTSNDWYPGDEYVDIIGYDKYNCTDWSTGSAVVYHNDSAISSTFYSLMERYNYAKMVAMTENDSFSTVENLTSEKAGWLYFCTWYDGGSDNINFLSNPIFNTEQDTIDMYQSEYCITLDELPATLYSEEIPTEPTEPTEPTTEKPTEEPTTDDGSFTFELMKESVDLSGREEGTSYELQVTIKGEPTASIGGGLGFGTNADDWVNLEWSGNADADGNLEITIPLDDVSVAITGGELQVWWSNVWDAATESSTDYPCEVVSIEVVDVSGETPTEDGTIETPTEDGKVEATLPGDANNNNDVEIADAIAIMSYVTNSEAFPLDAQQLANADVYQCGDGVGINDAVSIQKYITKLISELPESYNTAE